MQGPGVHGVFGSSGAGKTLLVRIISAGITGYKGCLRLKGIKTILYSYNMERLPGWSSIDCLLQQVTPSGREPLPEATDCCFRSGQPDAFPFFSSLVRAAKPSQPDSLPDAGLRPPDPGFISIYQRPHHLVNKLQLAMFTVNIFSHSLSL